MHFLQEQGYTFCHFSCKMIEIPFCHSYRKGGFYMVKLIASDLDGTLLKHYGDSVSDEAIELIQELIQRGVHFVCASGRQYECEQQLFAPIKDQISYIAENGALCIHKGTVLSKTVLEDDLCQRIIAEVKRAENFHLMISKEGTCYIEGKNPAFVDYVQNELKYHTKVVEDLQTVTGPILKLAVCNMDASAEVLNNYQKHLHSLFGSEIQVVTSGNIWIDLLSPLANKGTALKALLKELHIAPKDCIAFGDQYNDVEMLQLVGTGYAMANAAPGIAYYATDVVDSVEEVLRDLV
jgi:Cof subfamily protein (haloacid dehalogenase superfamily)